MGNPAEYDADTQEEQANENKQVSFSDRVNDAVKQMKQSDDGKWQLPDGLSEEVKVAAMAEKRYRDTQAEFTKTRQENKALKAEKSVLLNKAVSTAQINLTDEQKEELENLKFEDPEAWRVKMNTLEREARKKRQEELDEEVKQVSTSSLEEQEKELRAKTLEDFRTQYPDVTIDDNVIANDIPPRIVKKLENGDVTFDQFLEECYTYLKTGKVVADTKVSNGPNMNKSGGGNNPDENAVAEDVIQSYKSETY